MLFLFLGKAGFAQISGTVFSDHNQNGTQEPFGTPPERGIEGVVVNAFDDANAIVGTATTNASGVYSFTPSSSGMVRVEFVYPNYFFPAFTNAANQTVRFVTNPAANMDLGLHVPGRYCNSMPDILVNCYVFGNQTTGAYKDNEVLLTFPYSAGAAASVNTPVNDYTLPASHTFTVAAKDLGPTWGIGYRKTTKEVFTGATMKRHMGFGPNGSGAIYKLTYAPGMAAPNPTLFATLPTGTDPHDATNFLKDYKNVSGEPYINTHDAVGKIGIADIEVVEDPSNPANDRVFTINLYDRKLYELNANTGAVVSSFNGFLSLPGAVQGCPLADVRPFGLGKRDGKMYIGLVCTAESTNSWPGAGNGVWDAGEPIRDNGAGGGTADDNIQNGTENFKDIGVANGTNLRAYVYQYDPKTGVLTQKPSTEWNLDFMRGCVGNGNLAELQTPGPCELECDESGYRSARWKPWSPHFKTVGLNNPENRFIFCQPAISDIEFDSDDNMIISMWDRGGFQGGNQTQSDSSLTNTTLFQGQTSGDIHIAEMVNDSIWQLEINGTSNGITTGGASDGVGPGGGEYFYHDGFPLWQGTTPPFVDFMPEPNSQHQQVVIGGLAIIPGLEEVMIAVFDPIPVSGNFEDQGVHVYDIITGELKRAYRVVDGSPIAGMNPGPAAKDAGLGDLEALCNAEAIEIGNYVWKDTDKDGLQDPSEMPMVGVNVSLFNAAGVKIGSTMTSSTGHYLFNSANVDTTGANGAGGFTGLAFGKKHYIVLGEGQVTGGNLVIGGETCELTSIAGTNPETNSDGSKLAAGLPGALAALAGYPSATALSGGSGGNKQMMDFGFKAVSCQITVVSATPSDCDPADQTYSLSVVVNYSAQPTGNINLTTSNGGSISVAQTGSPQTINLTGLASDGVVNIDVTAVFANDGACTNTLADAYSAPFSCYMQMQSEFTTPTILSACNLDTICLTILNQKGLKNATYGSATISFNIPDGDLLGFVPGSVYSVPAGAVQTSYVNDVLTVTVPMPAFGDEVKICFAVRPSCDITTLTPLPQFHATINYPVGYPMPQESVSSTPMNVGAVSIAHTLYDQTTYGNPTPAFGAQFRIISNIQNTGFGTQKELVYYSVIPNDNTYQVTYLYDVTDGYTLDIIYPVSSVPYGAGHKLQKYVFKGKSLGADGLFTPNEHLRMDEYMLASAVCTTYTSKRWPEISCGAGEPLCQIPDTLYSTITQAAGTPLLVGKLVSIDTADGCPNKKGVFSIKNNGVGNAAPVGNAYDVDLGISFGGGLMLLSNIKLNGIAVPPAHLTPNGLPATTTTIKLKNLMTSDPDGAGVGIEDLDSDGFFDDMLVGAETVVSFDYTIPCNLACGSQLDYNLHSYNTFTDFCRTLVGATSTPIYRFGFEQVRALEQLEAVDYGALTTGQSATRTAKFKFQYKQRNMDFTNASGELHIKYSERMELNPATILLNGAAPTNPPVLYGTNSAGAPPDNDSMYVVTLTTTELTALFDTFPDMLFYDQTYYGCDIRQDNNVGDTWQLFVKVKQALCSDGSSACAFDVACKKPFVYTYNTGCGVKPCYVQSAKTFRLSPTGFTDVTEATLISPIDSSRSWTGDTVVYQNSFFITGDDSQEPNGFHTSQGNPHFDLRHNFSVNFTKPVGWNGTNSIWNFLPNFSSVCVYQRTPDPANGVLKGTIGSKIIEAFIDLSDFSPTGGATPASVQNSYNAVEYDYGSVDKYDPVWYCNTSPNSWHINGLCPVQNKYWYDSDQNNIAATRYRNVADDKMTELYYLNIGRALARAGWTGDAGDDNFYFEIKTKWQMNEDFPWDNSNSFSTTGYVEHLGDYLSFPNSYSTDYASSYNGSCGNASSVHLTNKKEHFISNPNSVYNTECTLKVNHDIFFETFEGNYFEDNEVRVPLKIDSIVIDMPTQFGVTPGTLKWKYNQSCGDLNSAAVTASALTGHIIFTNTAGGDFPRADDCSGNKVAYQLCYNIAKTGSAAPSQYRFPIKIYGRDEFDNIQILTDSATIAEAKPELVLTPLTPVLTPTDGGPCEPAFFDFRIQNNTLFDAGNVYFAAESSAGTTMVWINDGTDIYPDPIDSMDVSNYGAGNLFAKLGSIKAGDIRKVRVYANTSACSGSFNVFADYGCAYPSPMQPNLASTTLDQATAQYQAQAPGLTTLPKTPINIASMCDVKTVEVDVRNIRFGNLYNANVLFDLPAGASMVAGSARYRFPNTSLYVQDTVAPADVTLPAADKVNISLKNLKPFNTACGLPGADEFALSSFKVKFDIEFSACPTSSKDFILYTASAENYCGTKSSSQGVIRLNYVGTTAATNDYTLTYSASPIEVCAYVGETQIVKDTIVLKNIGGYGTGSGPSTGLETLEFTVILDTTRFQVSDFSLSAPFNAPILSYDTNGNLVIKTNVPAGIAVDSTRKLVMTYSLKPKVADLCKSASPEMCYSGVVKASPDLSCPAKSLVCAGNFASIQGHKFAVRPFKCCFVALGNLVFMDTDKDGKFTAGTDMGVNGVTVQLFKEGDDPATATPVATRTTAGGGFYLFDQLDQGKYFVFIPASNFTTGSPLNAKQSSSPEGTDDATDDSGNENGQNTPVAGGVTSTVIDLRSNLEPTGETGAGTYPGTLADNRVNMTVDFGFSVLPCDTTLAVRDSTICSGNAVNLFALVSGVKGTLTYSTDGSNYAALANPTLVSPTATATFFVKDSLHIFCQDVDPLKITVSQPVSAGTATNPADICAAATGLPFVNLFAQIAGETAGGTWTKTSGPAVGINFDAGAGTLDPNGLAAGVYVFEYAVAGNAPCLGDTELVTVTIKDCTLPCPPKVCLPVKIEKVNGGN